uniref:Uncharacterized protein n=1 Tax=Arundo donax TaxID=35708 RepID=A0A0A8Z267_ARUDO
MVPGGFYYIPHTFSRRTAVWQQSRLKMDILRSTFCCGLAVFGFDNSYSVSVVRL